LGILHAKNQSSFAGPVDRSTTGLAVDFGCGVKIFATTHLVLRPEFRIYAGNSGTVIETPFSDMRFSMGVGYAW